MKQLTALQLRVLAGVAEGRTPADSLSLTLRSLERASYVAREGAEWVITDAGRAALRARDKSTPFTFPALWFTLLLWAGRTGLKTWS